MSLCCGWIPPSGFYCKHNCSTAREFGLYGCIGWVLGINFCSINTSVYILRPEQNGWNLANANICNLTQMLLKFVPHGPTQFKSSLVQVLAWHETGDKQLSVLMMTQLASTYKHYPASLRLSWVIIPPETKFRGGILDSPCSSVRLSVRVYE